MQLQNLYKLALRSLTALACCFFALNSFSQTKPLVGRNNFGPYDTVIVEACIESNGDTIPCSWLQDAYVTGKLRGIYKKKYAEWTRLRNAVYVTYPYAITASKVMNDINAQLVNVTDKSKSKAIIPSKEKELKKEFAVKLRQLSVYQGKALI